MEILRRVELLQRRGRRRRVVLEERLLVLVVLGAVRRHQFRARGYDAARGSRRVVRRRTRGRVGVVLVRIAKVLVEQPRGQHARIVEVQRIGRRVRHVDGRMSVEARRGAHHGPLDALLLLQVQDGGVFHQRPEDEKNARQHPYFYGRQSFGFGRVGRDVIEDVYQDEKERDQKGHSTCIRKKETKAEK